MRKERHRRSWREATAILEAVKVSYMAMLLKSVIKTDCSDDSLITLSDDYIMMLMGGIVIKQVDCLGQNVRDPHRFPFSCYKGLVSPAKEIRSRFLYNNYLRLSLLIEFCQMFELPPIVSFHVV